MHDLMKNPHISLLGKGESNLNYLAEENGTKLVVRMVRDDVPLHNRLATEHHFMMFAEALKIKFAPKSVLYDPVQDIHIISYVDGKDGSAADLNEAQAKIFSKQLKLLDSIKYDDYLTWCRKSKQQPHIPHTFFTRNKINFDDRLQTIREHTKDDFAQKVLAWAEPKVEVLYEAAQQAKLELRFLHNDLRWNEGGGNLKISDDKVFFIDWELAGFFEDAVPEIGDVIGSIRSMNAGKLAMKRLYDTYTAKEKDIKQLDNSIIYGILWGKLGNPLWAAERYFLLLRINHPEIERYKILADRGMQDANPYFALPFRDWF